MMITYSERVRTHKEICNILNDMHSERNFITRSPLRKHCNFLMQLGCKKLRLQLSKKILCRQFEIVSPTVLFIEIKNGNQKIYITRLKNRIHPLLDKNGSNFRLNAKIISLACHRNLIYTTFFECPLSSVWKKHSFTKPYLKLFLKKM